MQTYDQVRQEIGRALFKDDWIGNLSARDQRDIKLYVEQKFPRPGLRVEVVAPLEKNIARRLDLALGRRARMWGQIDFVIDWMERNGIDWTAKAVSGKLVANALAKIVPDSSKSTPRTGPRDEKFRWALRMVENDLLSGSIDRATLVQMKLKEIQARYDVKKNIADKLKKRFALK